MDADNLTQGKFIGMQNSEKWFRLAEDIIQIVRRVHNNQIIHGEIDPKNFLIKSEPGGQLQPILVDFGKSFLLDVSLARSTTTERARNAYVAPECRNQRDAYTTTADIYALGGVLFYLSTGENPPDIDKWCNEHLKDENLRCKKWNEFTDEDVESWKNEIHGKFIKNKKLMEKHEGIVKIIDKCLRPLPEDRYASAEKLLQALDSVNYRKRNIGDIKIKTDLGDLQKKAVKAAKWDSLFQIITSDKIALLKKEMTDMARGHFEIYGEREDLIDSLVKYISVLKAGDTYITVTVPDYWTKDNLGINGRFLTVNKDLVRAGVHIRRLFLVSDEELKDSGSDSVKILKAHCQAYKDLGNLGIQRPTFDADIAQQDNGTMYVGICTFRTKDELKEYQRASSHVAMWLQKDTKKMMSIIFSSRSKYVQGKMVGSQIVKVRFRRQRGKSEYETMKKMFDDNLIRAITSFPGVI